MEMTDDELIGRKSRRNITRYLLSITCGADKEILEIAGCEAEKIIRSQMMHKLTEEIDKKLILETIANTAEYTAKIYVLTESEMERLYYDMKCDSQRELLELFSKLKEK